MALSDDLASRVRRRAADRCEYCQMHQALQGATFHIEHILPSSKGGLTAEDNLALSCPGCNLHKSSQIEAADPDSGLMVPLFHPRRDDWKEHLRWSGYQVVGLTPVGRATVEALRLNLARRIQVRQAEELFRLFPP